MGNYDSARFIVTNQNPKGKEDGMFYVYDRRLQKYATGPLSTKQVAFRERVKLTVAWINRNRPGSKEVD